MAEEITEQKLKDMKLHDQINLEDDIYMILIMRVVGGWIYWGDFGPPQSELKAAAGVFVPER